MADSKNTGKKRYFMPCIDDDGRLMEAAKDLVAQGIRIRDVYSPFPLHGIDPIIGVKRTRMAIAVIHVRDDRSFTCSFRHVVLHDFRLAYEYWW